MFRLNLKGYKKNIAEENYGIYSFYKSNINQSVIKAQKDVFSAFGLRINQIADDEISHGDFLNKICNDTISPEYIIFFDIDCIPIKKEAISKVLYQIKDGKTIAGAAQTCNHVLNGENLYVGPFFLGLSKTVYNKLNCPDMNEGSFWDVAGLLSIAAVYHKKTRIKYWYPTDVEEPKWDLYKNGKFGIGTTYENLVYHAFESRLGSCDNGFIKKCSQVLNSI